jgi:hypothetical protein
MKLGAKMALLGLLLSACSQQIPVLTPEIQATLLSNLRLGTATLDCGLACAGTWGGSLSEMNVYNATGDWTRLALRVMQIGFQEDLGYYYLGRSAEGLGAYEAAYKYYRIAGALATGPGGQFKCASAGLCNGLHFPMDLYPRIQVVQAELGRANRVVARRPSPKTPVGRTQTATAPEPIRPASASDEGWIDPPPVTH